MNYNKFDIAYLKMAQEWAKLSYCERRHVGALIVKDRMIISDGYNVVYLDDYSDNDGIEFLKNHNIEILKIPIEELK